MITKNLIQSQLVCAVCMTLLTASIISFGSCVQKSVTSGVERIEWSHVGIGGGSAQFNPSVSPHDENMAFVSCDMGGSFVTHDGGESWRMFNLDGLVRFFVFDPLDPDVVYAQSSGLYKSADKGLTWRLFYPKASDVVCKISKGDHDGIPGI